MTGLLYKTIRTNWGKILGFFIGCMFYPTAFALLFHDPKNMEDLEGEVTIMMWGFTALMTFLIGGVFQDSIFNDDERKKWAYFVTSTPTGIKGQIGSKYLIALLWSMLTVTMLMLLNSFAKDGNEELADGTVVFIGFFYIQLLMRSIEFPLMARFGSKMGKTMKIVIVGAIAFIAFVYILFGDTSSFKNLDAFWDSLFKAMADPEKMKKAALWFSIITAAVIPIYYLSYRLSVRWYLKGVESYEK